MDKIKHRLLSASLDMVRNLRTTADRLEKAIETEDISTLAEIQLSATSWTLDSIRGAAWTLLNFKEK